MRTKVSEFKKEQRGGIIVPFEEVSVLAEGVFHLCMYVVEELREMGPWLVEDVGSGQGFCLIWLCFYIEFSPGLPSFTNNLNSFGGQIKYAIHIHTSHTCNLWCMYVWYVFMLVYYFCLLKWPEISDTLIALSMSGPQFFICEYHSPIKNRSPFGEPATFRARPEKVQYEPRTSCCARKQGSAQRMLESHSEDTSQLDRGSHWPVMIVTDYSSLNKVENQEFSI